METGLLLMIVSLLVYLCFVKDRVAKPPKPGKSSPVGNLVVKITADTTGLRKELDDLTEKLANGTVGRRFR